MTKTYNRYIALAALALFGSGLYACASATDDASKAQITKLSEQRREVDMKLAKIRQRLEKTPAMKAALDKRTATWQAVRKKEAEARELTGPRQAVKSTSAAYRQLVDAKMAKNGKVASLQKKKAALEDKEAAVNMEKARVELEMRHRCSAIQRALAADEKLQSLRAAAHGKARDSREAKTYQAARKAKFEANPNAQKLIKVVEEKDEAISKIKKETREVWGAISQIRREIERGEDVAVVAARKRSMDAGKAYREACKKVLAPEQKANMEASHAFNQNSTALLEKDREARPLLAQRANIDKQIQDIHTRAREARRKPKAKQKPQEKK